MTGPILAVVLGSLSLLVVFFVAAAETAFTRITRARADAIAAADADDHPDDEAAHKRAEALRRYSRRPATTLASLAFAGLAAQFGAIACGWTVGSAVGGRGASIIGAIVAGVCVFIVVVIGRSRSLFAPDATAVRLVPVLRLVAPLGAVVVGLVRLVRRATDDPDPDPHVDEQELLALVEETAAIDSDEEQLIKRVVAFDDQVVGAIMTPRPDLITLRSGFAVSDALEVAALHGLSRIPVTAAEGDVDDIIGAVHVKDLMEAHLDDKGSTDIDLWLRTVRVVPEAQRAVRLLRDLKKSDLHLAVVVDEHGGVAGVVTLEDILEELVGEIEDEFDQPEPEVEVVASSTIRVDGRTEVQRVEETLGVDLGREYRTMAGCVFNGLGRVPEVGDVLRLDDPALDLEVLEMHGRRIAQIEVRSHHIAQPKAMS